MFPELSLCYGDNDTFVIIFSSKFGTNVLRPLALLKCVRYILTDNDHSFSFPLTARVVRYQDI